MDLETLVKLGLTEEVARQIIAMHEKGLEGLVSQEEIKNAIQKAREEERAKLYDRINSLEEQATKDAESIEAQKKMADESAKKVESLSSELETVKNNTKGGKVDVQAVIEETTKRISSEYEKMLSEERKNTSERMSQLEKQNNQLSIERYRDQRITQEGGENALIVAMVNGGTKEEIDNSIQAAKQEFAKLQERFGKQGDAANSHGNSPQGQMPPVTPPPVPKGGNPPQGGADALDSTLKSVRGLTPQQYAKQRADIRAAASKRFGS